MGRLRGVEAASAARSSPAQSDSQTADQACGFLPRYQRGPGFSPPLVPEKLVRTVGTMNILLPPKVASTIRQLLKVPPSDPYLPWVAREGVTGFRELVPFAGLPPTSWVIGTNSLAAPGPCTLIWQVAMRSLRSRAGVRVQGRRC